MSSLLLRGFALGFAIAASPGPIFFLCARRTLVQGRLTGLFSGLGVATADGFYAAVATFGIAAIADPFVAGRRPLAIVGGAVLVLLGLRIIFEQRPNLEAMPNASGRSLAWAYASTLGLTVTNPATIISFAALAATLGLGTGGLFLGPALVVVGVLLGSAAWWIVLVVAVSSLRARMTPQLVRWISAFSGLAIILLGLAAGYTALA